MRFSIKYIVGLIFCVVPIFSTSVFAASYDFDVTNNGVASMWDGIGDNPIGTALVDGDDFNYNFHAAGDDYWNVDVTQSYFPLLAFTIGEQGDRIGDLVLSFYLDGVQQGLDFEALGIFNTQVHLGTNSVSLNSGLMFDEIVMDYILLSSVDLIGGDPIVATIVDFAIGPEDPGGFNEGITYVSAVPIPAAAWLFISALGGLVVAKRKQLKA